MTLEEALAAKEEAEKKLVVAEENLRKAEEENGKLKTQVTEAAAAAEAVKAEKEILVAAEAAVKTELETAKTELATAKTELEAAQESANEEKALKEAAETSLAEKITAAKESIVDTVVKLRKAAGKGEEVTVDTLKERSEDSLKDAVTDLIEEITVSKQFVPGSVTNPSLSVNENLSNTDGKNKKAERSISLKEQVEDIFSDVIRARC